MCLKLVSKRLGRKYCMDLSVCIEQCEYSALLNFGSTVPVSTIYDIISHNSLNLAGVRANDLIQSGNDASISRASNLLSFGAPLPPQCHEIVNLAKTSNETSFALGNGTLPKNASSYGEPTIIPGLISDTIPRNVSIYGKPTSNHSTTSVSSDSSKNTFSLGLGIVYIFAIINV